MKKIGITFITSIILLQTLIWVKCEYSRKLYKKANYGIEKIVTEGKVTNLFIGSSMFRQGLDIYEIEKELGNDSYILAFNGNQPVFEFLELEYLINNGVKIENLFIDLYPYSAAAEPKISDIRLLSQTDMRFKMNIVSIFKDLNLLTFPTIWEMFVTSNNEELFTFFVNHKIIDNLYYKGGNIQEKPGISLESMNLLSINNVEEERLNNCQKEYLYKIINLCKEKNICLSFIETPKWYEVYKNVGVRKVMMEYINLLQEENVPFFLSKSVIENVDIEKEFVEFNSYEAQYFLDTVHLSSSGRKKYTKEFCILYNDIMH